MTDNSGDNGKEHDAQQQQLNSQEQVDNHSSDEKKDATQQAKDADLGGASNAGFGATEIRKNLNPAKKRAAEKQLSKDDRDEDYDGLSLDEKPALQRASEEVLSRRRIVKAPRTATGEIDKEAIAQKKANPFSGVTLQAVTTDVTTAPGKASDKDATKVATKVVFGSSASFSGFGATAKNASGGFGATVSGASAFASSLGSGSGFGFATAKGFGEAHPNDSTASDKTITFPFAKSEARTDLDGENIASVDKAAFAVTAQSSVSTQFPDQYDLKSGEENEIVCFVMRCKSYRWGQKQALSTQHDQANAPACPRVPGSQLLSGTTTREDAEATQQDPNGIETTTESVVSSSESNGTDHEWIEVGIGRLKALQLKDRPSHIRLVQRREATPNGVGTKVIVNIPLYQESRVSQPSEKCLSVTSVNDSKPVQFLFKFGMVQDATEVKQKLESLMTEAKSMF